MPKRDINVVLRAHDKELMAIDTTVGQAYSHTNRIYVIWDENNNERVAYSDNGTTWTTVVLENTGSDIGGDLAIGADGAILVPPAQHPRLADAELVPHLPDLARPGVYPRQAGGHAEDHAPPAVAAAFEHVAFAHEVHAGAQPAHVICTRFQIQHLAAGKVKQAVKAAVDNVREAAENAVDKARRAKKKI